MAANSLSTYPLSPRENLLSAFVGCSLQDVPVPAAVLDISKLKKSCLLMLKAVEDLQVSFRAHVKTHKTTELTQLQVGENCKDVRLIVSTVSEAEHLVPLLRQYLDQGARVNVLYGVPVGPSKIERLAKFATSLGTGSLTLMIDNPAQLSSVSQIHNLTHFPIKVFVKTDSGYHRAGLGPLSPDMEILVQEVVIAEQQGHLELLGFYSHNSLSYGGISPSEAMDNLRVEIEACRQAINNTSNNLKSRKSPITISCGASPTALSLQNIQSSTNSKSSSTTSAQALREALRVTKDENIEFEIHAGVYPVFDMQQVEASSRDTFNSDPHDSIALSILAEVCSLYPERTENPEALISAGCLALAREPCHGYPGWGVLSNYNMPSSYNAYGKDSRIIVSRISQEHGILGWEDKTRKEPLPLEFGQKLRIWPNHACITGAMFVWYLIVDGQDASGGDKVIDVWVRWRGW